MRKPTAGDVAVAVAIVALFALMLATLSPPGTWLMLAVSLATCLIASFQTRRP